jgi:hypothetical protein
MQGSTNRILADVTDPVHPRTMCTFTGAWSPQLVTQTLISWWASQGTPGSPGTSLIATLDVSTGAGGVVASWSGGDFMDGLHGWSPDHGSLAYVTSDATAVDLHLLSGGGDRIVAVLGSVPGGGTNPDEDDAFVGFSADGLYFALVQTYASSGDQLQVRKTSDGSLAYSQANGTMATWGSTGSRLYFRQTLGTAVDSWDPTAGVAQAIGQPLAWIRPRADTGDDYLTFTVRDSGGNPHVWLYGHNGRAGGQLPNVRSTVAWLTTTTVFLVEEVSCGSACGPGPPTQPDMHTFTFNTGTQAETTSTISQVLATWPRPGQ